MSQGLIIISVGVVVVMGILVLLVGLIEALVRLDYYFKARARMKKARLEDHPSRMPAEVVVAIGMALHQFQEEREQELAVLDRPRYSGWTSSGRLDIMAARQRITFRG